MAAATIETIQKLKFEHLSHQAYSSHLTPCTYHNFGLFRDELHRHRFANNEEVKDVAHMASCATADVLCGWY
jgi:hypothetical protein